MKYIYKAAAYFTDELFLREVSSACHRLHKKLNHIEPSSLGISEYNQRYLASKLTNTEATLTLYAYLLSLCLSNTSIALDRFIFIDYGGGTGFLSLLAKEMGIGMVLYNDIYDVSCRDVQRLSHALELGIDGIICGNIDDVIAYVQKKRMSIDAIASYDVIEHIYNIREFFHKMPHLSRHRFRVVHASTANVLNPFYVRRVRKLHQDREFENRDREWGWKERDTLRSYFEVRKEIIAAYAPELTEAQGIQLAHRTRGLRKGDIEKCIDEYREKGDIAYRPHHPTNTCDPYTGNWAERLMRTVWLEDILERAGFSVKILSGYRLCCGRLPMKAIRFALNWTTGHMQGRRSLWFSPYYVLCADMNSDREVLSSFPADTLKPVCWPVRMQFVAGCKYCS